MLLIINKIKAAKGNEKITIMAKHPELKKVLKYAYDPFKKYYMSAPDLEGTFNGEFWLDEMYSILDELSTRKLSGHNALGAVCDHIVSCSPNTAELFKMILNKDLRCGINIKSINKAFPGLIPLAFDGAEKPAVMLLKTFDPKQAKYPCLAAIKKDGDRGLTAIQKLQYRSGRKVIGLNHIEEALVGFDHEFDGELTVPGCDFDTGSGLIRNDSPVTNAEYHIFDVPSVPGTKNHRYNALKVLEKKFPSFIKVIEHRRINNAGELKNFYEEALELGEEGIVIYDPDSLYEDKRSYDWTRLVPIKSADCPVVGFFEGKGKHEESLGGIVVDYKGHKVKVGTGFSEKVLKAQLKQLLNPIDKKLLTLDSKKLEGYKVTHVSPIWQRIRQFIWDNKDQFKGVVAELEFKEETKAGSMRQPRFKHWRWDK